MFCPKCKTEYIEGITHCADCKIPLVQWLPGEERSNEESAAVDNDLFPIMTFQANEEALIAKGFLESNGVAAILSSEETFHVHGKLSSFRGIQLLIRKEDQQDAEDIFRLAGIHPQEMPYFYRREEIPLMDTESNWKRLAARLILLILFLTVVIFLIKHLQ